MCLLAYLPKNKTMSIDEVLSAHKINDDGMGIAYEVNGQWFVEKGIANPQELHEKIENLKDYRKIVHFRAASAGGVDPDLTHPFETRKFIIAHNGTLTNWQETANNLLMIRYIREKWFEYNMLFGYNPEKISDTKLMAFLLYLAEENTATMNRVVSIINSAGKVALVVKELNTVIWFGERKEDDGRIFSNESYRVSYLYTRNHTDKNSCNTGCNITLFNNLQEK